MVWPQQQRAVLLAGLVLPTPWRNRHVLVGDRGGSSGGYRVGSQGRQRSRGGEGSRGGCNGSAVKAAEATERRRRPSGDGGHDQSGHVLILLHGR